jgi:hypothetical protein
MELAGLEPATSCMPCRREAEHRVLQGTHGAGGRGARTPPQRALEALDAEHLAHAVSALGMPSE